MTHSRTPPSRSVPSQSSVQRSSAEPRSRGEVGRAAVRGLSFEAGARALSPVQGRGGALGGGDVQAIAGRGVAGGGGALPHGAAIQRSFGRHGVGDIQAHVGGAAAEATGALGASAYATGNSVAFGSSPDLHTAAHEAAHVVQQRAGVSLYGGVGQAGDVYEKHADAVADKVVAGESAEGLLDRMAGAGGGAARSGGPVQMYSRLPVSKQKNDHWNAGVDLRVADDGRMAVADATHQMWATQDIIAHGDNVLLSQKSPYSLTAGSGTLEGRVPGQKKSPVQTLHEVVPMNYANGTIGDDMRTIEACSSHGQHLMGAGPEQGEHGMAKGMAVVTKNGQGKDEERNYDKRGMSGNGRPDGELVGDIRNEVTGGQRDQSEKAYGKMSNKKKAEKAKELGINQYAEPEVGEGLAVYAAVKDKQKGHFPMHFVPVIAKSGGDYVTLENYAKTTDRKQGDTSDSSNDWYFKMFGPVKKGDDQSFYGENAKQGDYGGDKGTMVLRHRMVEGYDEPQELLDAKPVMEKCGRWAYYVNSKIYPTFAGQWFPFKKAWDAVRKELVAAWTEKREPDAKLLDDLDKATREVLKTDTCQELMNDQKPTPEVKAQVPDGNDTLKKNDDTSNDDDEPTKKQED